MMDLRAGEGEICRRFLAEVDRVCLGEDMGSTSTSSSKEDS